MDSLTLISHLARRRDQLRAEWVREAGAYYLLTQGFTHSDAPGQIPMPLAEGIHRDRELELRHGDLVATKARIDELNAEIHRIAGEERTA